MDFIDIERGLFYCYLSKKFFVETIWKVRWTEAKYKELQISPVQFSTDGEKLLLFQVGADAVSLQSSLAIMKKLQGKNWSLEVILARNPLEPSCTGRARMPNLKVRFSIT